MLNRKNINKILKQFLETIITTFILVYPNLIFAVCGPNPHPKYSSYPHYKMCNTKQEAYDYCLNNPTNWRGIVPTGWGCGLNPWIGQEGYRGGGGYPTGYVFTLWVAYDSSYIPMPKNEGNGSCPNQTGGTNPINLGVGNKYQTEIDYISQGFFPLSVERTYNSISGVWRFLPEIKRFDSTPTFVTVVRSDGKQLSFNLSGSGSWDSDPDVTGKLDSLKDSQGNITGWRYITLEQQVEEYDATGRLLSVTSPDGIAQSYQYGANTININHSHGKELIYHLDTTGRISGFTTPDTDYYGYSYDGDGNLTSITFPNNGGNRTYHYEDVNFPKALTGITDAKGNRYATWTYDTHGRAISSEHAGGVDLVTVDNTYADDETDPRVTATNALGKQSTYHFETINGVKKVTQVDGHPSANCAAANKAYSYDVNGFVTSKTDWNGNITNYTRDSRGRELTRTEAVGTPKERTIITTWDSQINKPLTITESDRITEFTYDTEGRLLSKQAHAVQ